MMNNKLSATRGHVSAAMSFSVALLIIVFLPVVIATIGFAFGYLIQPVYFPVAAVVAVVAEYLLCPSKRLVAYTMLIVVGLTLLMGLFYDYCYDSNAYHKPMVIWLTRGWNLLDTNALPDTKFLVTIHYAKFIEFSQACLVSFTGVLEQGKAINLLLGLSMCGLAYDFLRNQGFTRKRSLIILFVVIANPVFSTQILSFYVDYVIYVCIVMTIILATNIANRRHTTLSLAMTLVVTMIAIGTKFNAFFYQGVTLMLCVIWLLIKKDQKGSLLLIAVGVTSLALTPLLFYHPYVTNYIIAGHPLYPLMGDGAINIMLCNTPSLYIGHNRFVNLLLSIVVPDWNTFPFTIGDTRISGFTIVGMPIMVISIVMLAMAWKKTPKVIYYIAFWVIASCFFFEQGWWARYIPQLWLLPVLAIYVAYAYCPKPALTRKALPGFVIIAFLLSGASNLCRVVRNTCYFNSMKIELVGHRVQISNYWDTDIYLLDQWGIEYEAVDTLTIDPAHIYHFTPHATIGYLP